MSHDREKLSRSYEFRMEPSGDDGLTLEGYAAVFNDWTTINDRTGSFQEQIAPGAFKRSLGMRSPVIQFDHGQHPLIGTGDAGNADNFAFPHTKRDALETPAAAGIHTDII